MKPKFEISIYTNDESGVRFASVRHLASGNGADFYETGHEDGWQDNNSLLLNCSDSIKAAAREAARIAMDPTSQAAAALGRAKSPAKTAAARENGKRGGRPKASAWKRVNPFHIAEEYRDDDGYWIALRPGFKSAEDPVGACHTIREDSKREAYAVGVMVCRCPDCVKDLARIAKL